MNKINYSDFFYVLLIVIVIAMTIFLAHKNADATEVVSVDQCTAYFPCDPICVDNEWRYTFDEIPASEGKPEYIVLGNYYHLVYYVQLTKGD